MGKIIFYEDRDFQGRSYECNSDCPELTSYLSRCTSIKVESGCFMVYERPNYMGSQFFLKRGEFPDCKSMSDGGLFGGSIQSCRMIPQYRGLHKIKIYERENFGGMMQDLTDDCESFQDRFRMSDCQSCHVMDGHWLMYEQPHYRGRMMYLRPGEYRNFRDLGDGSMRFASVRRIVDS